MKVLLLLISIALLSCSQNNRDIVKTDKANFIDKKLILTPGIGFPEIQIGEILQKDKFYFRGKEFRKDEGESIACGYERSSYSYWIRYSCIQEGLIFEYNSGRKKRKILKNQLNLSEITLTKLSKGCTTNGCCIGETTYQEVIEKYGQIPSDWKNPYYLSFSEKGVSFWFDEKSVIIKIKIFKPYLKQE